MVLSRWTRPKSLKTTRKRQHPPKTISGVTSMLSTYAREAPMTAFKKPKNQRPQKPMPDESEVLRRMLSTPPPPKKGGKRQQRRGLNSKKPCERGAIRVVAPHLSCPQSLPALRAHAKMGSPRHPLVEDLVRQTSSYLHRHR